MMRFISFAMFAALPAAAAAQLAVPPEAERSLSRLAPIDMKSDWYPRFERVGVTLGLTLADGPSGAWQQYFGGRWLAEADRARITARLSDETTALNRVLVKAESYEQVILGWQPPEGASAYADLADRPEADAIICWRAAESNTPWPVTATEAEDARQHACVRVSYSIRFDPPQWRAFMDAPESASGD